MGLSVERILKHIQYWQSQLNRDQTRQYRAKWPKFLFRHEPLENAVKVIQSAQLLARRDAVSIEHIDIAAPDVVSSRKEAHPFTRLYFRPLNPTQYNVEGIRKTSDLYDKGNQQIHAPIIVMFLFSAESILSLADTHFSDGNMQSPKTTYDSSEDFFNSIPFEDVFHEGSFDTSNRKILVARCAEVLAKSPLKIIDHLVGIRCRSEAEKNTLLHLCGSKIAPELRSKIKVYSEVGLFQSHYAYIKTVDLSAQGVKFTLNPRRDSLEVTIKLSIETENGELICNVKPTSVDPARTQRISIEIPDGIYLISIWVENHLAYQAKSSVDSFPF
jgi:hypothetical protein